ncbi:MAG: hypothetical protein ACSLE0_15945, partial [Chitinophagaceae bacterium]
MLLRLANLSMWLVAWVFSYSQVNTLPALRIAASPPRIDGSLEDNAWKEAPVATGFIQNFPSFGSAASQKTEVRIVYDDSAIYIGAYLYDNP